jgi:hypothetical protein
MIWVIFLVTKFQKSGWKRRRIEEKKEEGTNTNIR